MGIHVKSEARETWAAHSVSGFNVGTSFEHNRCYEVWIKETQRMRVGNTVSFKHKYLSMPTITPEETLLKTAEELKAVLEENIL